MIRRAPPDTAGDVLDACIKDWVGFANRTRADAGAFNLPSKPDIGFLLRFIGVAVNFAETRKATPAQTKRVPQIAKPPVPSVDTHPRRDATADKATLAEVRAILEGLT